MENNDLIDPKEKLLIEYLIANKKSLVRCITISKSEYFDAPLDRVVSFVVDYFNKHHGCPSTAQINAETGVQLEKRTLEEHEESYFLQEYESHCRQKAMTNAILSSVDLIQEGKEDHVQDLVREALLVKIDNSIGSSLFDDPVSRINNMQESVDERKLGIDVVDELVGNIRRGELGLFYAVSSGGKSVMLANVAYLLAEQGLDVAAISFELNEDLYNKRLDCITTGMPISTHDHDAEEINNRLAKLQPTMGDITTKKMRAKSTPADVRAYIMEYHLLKGKYPDVLIVDYLALMGTTTNYSNKFDEHEDIAVSLRDMADEFQMYMFSANQVNREGQDVIKLGPQHVAGGLSVIMASDWALAMTASEQDIENNQITVSQLKIRNASKTPDCRTIYRDPNTLRMSGSPMSGKKLSSPLTPKKKGDSIDESSGKKKMNEVLKKL